MESLPLDPSLPGVRLLQHWIREKTVVSLQVQGGQDFEGVLDWQDPEFLALRYREQTNPILIRRQSVVLIRSLG
jgi:host factor-I protein